MEQHRFWCVPFSRAVQDVCERLHAIHGFDTGPPHVKQETQILYFLVVFGHVLLNVSSKVVYGDVELEEFFRVECRNVEAVASKLKHVVPDVHDRLNVRWCRD